VIGFTCIFEKYENKAITAMIIPIIKRERKTPAFMLLAMV
jgi:hypothetical protein